MCICAHALTLSLCLSLQVRGHSHAPGLSATRSLHARMSWRGTTAHTQGRRSLPARCVRSASCAATTSPSTPGATPPSIPPWSSAQAVTASPPATRHPAAWRAAPLPARPPARPSSYRDTLLEEGKEEPLLAAQIVRDVQRCRLAHSQPWVAPSC